jgi:hypothetical protein
MMEEPEPVAFLNLVQPDPMVRALRGAHVARALEDAARESPGGSGLGMCDASACPCWR